MLEDRDTLRHMHGNVIAGCCMALGLRFAYLPRGPNSFAKAKRPTADIHSHILLTYTHTYRRFAGSAEKRAADLLIHYLEHFQKLRSQCEGHRKVDKQLITE